ncbi:SURF1 family protein [Pararoseomonas indoligenes]|uniref:SURF1-like protein n=1 Tax=Roseomonas indoligenes TaxID=2820811 RepID=A0A940S647_9PROT|nr:SURF1 family protein [Pararoseomonas indoligenes]MBP0491578.1 SURF1 family protein [Pararoseomonas indoligenes]
MTSRPRRILPAVLASIPVLAILLVLGTWQVRRLAWKTDLLATIAAAEAGPPVPLTVAPQPFTKVTVTGRFRYDLEAVLGVEVRGSSLGTHLVTPLEAEGLPPVLVNRGWVPMQRDGVTIARPDGRVTVVGYVSPPHDRDFFAATDDLPGRRFYTADAGAIGAALGLPGTMPDLLVALRATDTPRDALPQPAETLPRPSNSHLGYAITWYGLAASLLGVLIAWAIRKDDA